MDVFFYGALLDPDIREIVFGDPHYQEAPAKAVLRGYRRVCVPGETYPYLLPFPKSAVEGIAFPNLNDVAMARLLHFEGNAYRLAPVTVEREAEAKPATLMAFFRAGSFPRVFRPWDFETWTRFQKRRALTAARAHMKRFRPN
ncbi:MAG: gamma-glutamylcyclotransferase family protein [Alphaproteobacteria bacterium]